MNDDIKKLVAQYKESFSSMTEKKRAEEERDLYLLANPNGRDGKGGKREWLAAYVGGATQHFEQRAMLLTAGPWVNPLWEMFDKDTSRSTIIQLFRNARNTMVRKQIPGEEALKITLDEYNNRGHEARTSSGKTYRRMSPLEKQRSSPPSPMKDMSIEMDMDASQNRRSKQFFSQMTALSDEFVRTSLVRVSGIDELTIKIAKDEFTSFIQEACNDFRRRVYVMRSASKKDHVRAARITREKLREAAEVLGISIVWDQDIDLRKAKKIMFRRCAQLHPDHSNTSDEQKAEYRAVVEAYNIIERYMEGRKTNEVGERSHGHQ
jgi:hypothetical protein